MNIFGVMALPSYLNVLAIFAQTGLDFIPNPLIHHICYRSYYTPNSFKISPRLLILDIRLSIVNKDLYILQYAIFALRMKHIKAIDQIFIYAITAEQCVCLQ